MPLWRNGKKKKHKTEKTICKKCRKKNFSPNSNQRGC